MSDSGPRQAGGTDGSGRGGGPRCPICGKPAVERYKPFCSRRCADIDLGRWLKGGYAIPAREEPEEDEEGSDDKMRDDSE